MDIAFGIAVLEIIIFCSIDYFVGLNPVWIIIIEIALVAAIAMLHIESVILTELRKHTNQGNQNDDEIK